MASSCLDASLLACWLQQVDVSTQVVYGLTIKSWGRIGKVLQAMAALTVLIDLLGAEWFRRLGLAIGSRANAMFPRTLGTVGSDIVAAPIVNAIIPTVLFRLRSIARNARRLRTDRRAITARRIPWSQRKRGLSKAWVHLRLLTRPAVGRRRKALWLSKQFSTKARFSDRVERFVVPVTNLIGLLVGIGMLASAERPTPVQAYLSALVTMILVIWLLGFLLRGLIATVFLVLEFLAGFSRLVGWALGHQRNEFILKLSATLVFFVGFLLDMLAS